MSSKYNISDGIETMMAVVTTGNGGYDNLKYRHVPIPQPDAGEVLIKVLAAGMNNTEINTRLGWYSESVTEGTGQAGEQQELDEQQKSDGGWNAATPFPFIQGTDCCGRVVKVYPGEDDNVIGSRVLVRACMRLQGFGSMGNIWMGSDFDGAFAEYVKVPASEVFPVNCEWSDAELATIPCAYGTAENMIHRAGVSNGSAVLVTGASGGVGSAAVQLAKRRGAEVIAISGQDKMTRVKQLGANLVLSRNENLTTALDGKLADVVIDNVAGDGFKTLLKSIRRDGRYVSSGAIAGPIVELDMRDFYLKDITMIGCTAWDEPIFPNLVNYIENNEIKSLLAKVFPLSEIVIAQKEFLKKQHFGNFVLLPPQPS